jgi:hypothetical protein
MAFGRHRVLNILGVMERHAPTAPAHDHGQPRAFGAPDQVIDRL